MSKTRDEGFFSRLIGSVWLFPVILGFIVIGLSALRISGSSVGIYHQIIYGQETKDPDLLYGSPRPVRSDEWLFVTQLTISQAKHGFPRFNHDIGNGRDMSLVGNVPYKDWSSAFRPENFSFFVMPLENAFAFKWWFLLYSLIVSCYFFCLRIFKERRGLAILFGLAIGCTPFVFWWYITTSFGSLTYGFLILILVIRMVNGEPVAFLQKRQQRLSNLVYGLCLAYLLTAFGLLLYPPFQIPVIVASVFFLAGYLIDTKSANGIAWRKMFWRLVPVIAAGLLSATLLLAFLLTRHDAVNSLMHTAYPGQRVSTSGHLDYLNVFDGFLQPQLQSFSRGGNFFNNQSESSNFIMLAPFLILPGLVLTAWRWRSLSEWRWTFLGVQLAVLIFLARMFLPAGDLFYKPLLLNRVPNERLVIGLGFAGVLQMLLLLKLLYQSKLSRLPLFIVAAFYSLICFVILWRIGLAAEHSYPHFIAGSLKIVLLAAGFSAVIFLLLFRQAVLAAGLLLVFSFGSVFRVHPLYKGLGWVNNNRVYTQIAADSAPDSHWAVADNIVFENLPLLAGRPNFSGIQPYPDKTFWRQADGRSADDIYNRYAHVLFISGPNFKTTLHLVQPDFFEVSLRCSSFIEDNIDYVLDANNISDTACLKRVDTVHYQNVNFNIFKVMR